MEYGLFPFRNLIRRREERIMTPKSAARRRSGAKSSLTRTLTMPPGLTAPLFQHQRPRQFNPFFLEPRQLSGRRGRHRHSAPGSLKPARWPEPTLTRMQSGSRTPPTLILWGLVLSVGSGSVRPSLRARAPSSLSNTARSARSQQSVQSEYPDGLLHIFHS